MEVVACPSCGYNSFNSDGIYKVCKSCGTKVMPSAIELTFLEKERERRIEERRLMREFEEAADNVIEGLERENYKVSSNLEGLGCLVSILFVVGAFLVYACMR